MKTLLKKMTAGLLSACMLTGMLPPLFSASAAETEASVRDTFRSLIYSAWEKHQAQVSVRSLRLPLDTAANLYYEMLYTDADYAASNACYEKIGYILRGKLCTVTVIR